MSLKAAPLVLLLLVPTIMFSGISAQNEIMSISPLKQFKLGSFSSDIQCNPSFVLLVKKTNGEPACVKISSVEPLKTRGYISPKDDYKIIVTNKTMCTPIKQIQNVIENSTVNQTRFQAIGIIFGWSNSTNISGVVQLSSSNDVLNIPAQSGILHASYVLGSKTTITNCGISYCSGDNCNPDKELQVSNSVVSVTNTRLNCPVCDPNTKICPMRPCISPSMSVNQFITANSSQMESGKPYTYKFYLLDNMGKYTEWFFKLRYNP